MPRVEIYRGNPQIPSTTGQPFAQESQLQNPIGQAMQSAGDASFGIGLIGVKEAKQAYDANYVSNSLINVEKQTTDIAESLHKANQNPSTHVQDYTQQVEPIYAKALKDAPSNAARKVLQERFATMQMSGYKTESEFQNKAINAGRISSYEESLNILGNKLLRNPDSLDSTMASHQDLLHGLATFLSPQELEKYSQRDKQFLAQTVIQGHILQNPNEAIRLLKSGEFDSVLDPSVTLGLINASKQQINKNRVEADKVATQAHTDLIDNMDLGIFQGKVGIADVTKSFNDGNLTVPEFIQRSKKINDEIDKQISQYGDINVVKESLANGLPLDPTDTGNKKAVDTFYQEAVLPQLQGRPEEDSKQLQIEYINKVGIIPDTLKGQLLGGLSNGSAAQKVTASNFINQLLITSPHMSKNFTPEELAYSRTIADSTGAGMTQEDAIKAADVHYIDHNTEEYKQRVKDFNKNAGKFNLSDYNNSHLFSVGQPTNVPNAMQTEWEQNYRHYAVDLMQPLHTAKDLATKQTDANWTQTDISGHPQWMKFAPEKEYGFPGQDNSWIKKQLDAAVVDHQITKGLPLTTENLDIVTDPRTYNSPAKTYMVGFRNSEGAFNPLMDNNNTPLTWRPNASKSPEAQKIIQNIKIKTDQMDQFKLQHDDIQKIIENKRIKDYNSTINSLQD